MRRIVLSLIALTITVGDSTFAPGDDAGAVEIKRGSYLVRLAGCNDCHTPGYLVGKPDMSRFLGGSDVGFEVPGLGIFVGSNLTPDRDTGLGRWTKEEIATALQKGMRPDGRGLAPTMPWRAYAHLTKPDVDAIVDFLKSLPPIHNKVAGPFGPGEKPTVLRMVVLPPSVSTSPNP
jgi:mono/diheme cytochrome c family protein